MVMVSDLWSNKNYLVALPYITATDIYEYDIRKANINVLRSLDYISQDYYDKLNAMPKINREIEVGYLIRNDKDLSNILSDGIMHYRKLLFEANNIDSDSVLSIKNDAIFIIGRALTTTAFTNGYGCVEFVKKNHYTSYYLLSRLEVYFKSDMINNSLVIDIKGLGDKINLHKLMVAWIAEILSIIETGDLEYALKEIQIFYNQYISRELDIEYYRPLNPISMYVVNTISSVYGIPYLDNSADKNSLDISYNLQIIRTLYGYASQMYFARRKS